MTGRWISGGIAAATAVVVAAGLAVAAPAPRVATMSGETKPNATGRAALRIDPAANKVCFEITFEGVADPNFGSINRGNGNGEVFEVELFNGDRGPRSSPVKGCARDVPRPILREIKEHPRRFWVNTSHYSFHDSAMIGRIRKPQ